MGNGLAQLANESSWLSKVASYAGWLKHCLRVNPLFEINIEMHMAIGAREKDMLGMGMQKEGKLLGFRAMVSTAINGFGVLLLAMMSYPLNFGSLHQRACLCMLVLPKSGSITM